ncbi:aminoimidazole riboside kinase [Natroniella sulfidigena]|uniref:aminoimidazole riboside kinase n=1 Tax=Natroniella sulfidigena TaxID=723921 RepID=UPI002009EA95|nr:aminoimidazole riboside kinase [Natroniella sulfidigena]MCK8817721.1 aminoimidazole riboside kinase [Natroniella sulfidigena]
MKKGVITLGEALIDFIPLDKTNTKFKKNPGGAPANVAVGVSKLGAKASFVGKVGADLLGQFLQETLQNNGVNTEGMILSDQAKTQLVFVTLDQSGERSFEFYAETSADALLSKDELSEGLFKNNKIFHYGSISLINEPARSATEYAVELARKNDLLISYDPNLRLSLWDDAQKAKEGIVSMLGTTDILKVSDEELEFITGETNIESGSKVLADKYDIPLIIVTCGSQGAYYYYQEQLYFIPAMKVETVDTTGAGDAFVSGVLYKLNQADRPLTNLDSKFLNSTVEFASISGALAASAKGAMVALPTVDKVEQILAER